MKDEPKKASDEAERPDQVQLIIEAAEEAATEIIAEAEAKAARYVDESRRRTEEVAGQQAMEIWTLTDALIARAEAVKRQSDELLEALNQTKRGAQAAIEAAPSAAQMAPPQPTPAETGPRSARVVPPPPKSSRQGAAGSPSGPATPPPRAPVEPPVARSAMGPVPPPPPAAPGQPSEGARLLATQMAVAGSSREEIIDRLRDDFGVDEAGPMLDSILGRA